MREWCRALFGVMLRIFFRRVEVAGLERVPTSGPVIFVLNHPNALIDPGLVLCLAPRRVSFLAKAPLFRMPLIGFFARALEAIPVYRRQDNASDTSKNRETFESARRVLAGGGAIAIFPEGTSHSDPKMRPFKTGAARIALGAAAGLPGSTPLAIVPAGLYYRAKQTFRSAALLSFGEPFVVEPVPLAPGAEPPAGAVHALTARIGVALAAVTVQTERTEALALIERAERIVSATDDVPGTPAPLTSELELRRRLVAGYPIVRERWPERFDTLRTRIDRYEMALRATGIEPCHLAPRSFTLGRVTRYVAQSLAVFMLILPPALAGLVIHYPAYRIVGSIAAGISRGEEESLATIKVLAALLLFPLSWAVVALTVWVRAGPGAAAVVMPFLPIAGYAALVFFERLDRLVGRGRALALFTFRRWAFLRLLAERRSIRDTILELAAELEPGGSVGHMP
jgi:1-acyl-sn-glycerol-3-phosphate acyltransferase